MSILNKDELADLRQSEGIVPDEEDDTVFHYRRRTASQEGVTPTVNDEGVAVTTSADPDTPLSGYELIGQRYCRVESASRGRERGYGGTSTEVAPWDLVMPAIEADGTEIEVLKADVFLVLMDDSTYRRYEAVSADDGETYGVLLTVNCQYINI